MCGRFNHIELKPSGYFDLNSEGKTRKQTVASSSKVQSVGQRVCIRIYFSQSSQPGLCKRKIFAYSLSNRTTTVIPVSTARPMMVSVAFDPSMLGSVKFGSFPAGGWSVLLLKRQRH